MIASQSNEKLTEDCLYSNTQVLSKENGSSRAGSASKSIFVHPRKTHVKGGDAIFHCEPLTHWEINGDTQTNKKQPSSFCSLEKYKRLNSLA